MLISLAASFLVKREMVAGIVHLVAPQAKIMPLKSFGANGAGHSSDILRAIYYAVGHGAKVMNMSFNFSTFSLELANAITHATSKGVISVASAGNNGRRELVYPAALPNVIDVASTSNTDTVSSFSNYGAPPVWMAAPGEAVDHLSVLDLRGRVGHLVQHTFRLRCRCSTRQCEPQL